LKRREAAAEPLRKHTLQLKKREREMDYGYGRSINWYKFDTNFWVKLEQSSNMICEFTEKE
jgi:hypothetical protein